MFGSIKVAIARTRAWSLRASILGLLAVVASPATTTASPAISYGNIDGVNRGTDACDPDAVFEKLKAEKFLVAPVDLRVRGIAVRVPYKVEENQKVGTHGFTRRVGNQRKFHAGTDLLGDEGEDIVAVVTGKVIATGSSETLGNYAILRTDVVIPPALPCAVDFVYAHMKSTANKGDVLAGAPIGKVGRTGNLEASIPTHLHIEVWVAPYAGGLEERIRLTRDIMALFRPY